jgi:branched-chain amino acid transport system substrate-binding protein
MKEDVMKRLFLIILIVAFCTMLLSVQAQEQIKIGCLFPLTGDLARLGVDSYQGAELARLEQNEKGGLFGKEIVFVMGDAVTPKVAGTEVERLITKEGVDIILGTYSSSLSYVASQIADKYGKIYWELGATATNLNERGFKNFYRLCARATQYGSWAVESVLDGLLPKLGIKPEEARIAGIFEDSLMGTERADSVVKEMEKRGLKLVMSEFYSSKSIDLSPLIMQLKQAKPDVLLASQYLNDAILFQKQSKELNFYVKIFVGLGGGLSMGEFKEALGNDVVGLLETSFFPTAQHVNPEYAPGSQEIVEKYEKVFGKKMTSTYPVINYTGTMVLWKVLEMAGSLDPEKVRESVFKLDIPDKTTPVGYGFKFDETGQNIRARVVTTQWKKDDYQYTVEPAEAAEPGSEVEIPLLTWEEKKALE